MLSSSFSNILHKHCIYYSSSQLSIHSILHVRVVVKYFCKVFFIYFEKVCYSIEEGGYTYEENRFDWSEIRQINSD